jgi:hypothetical protein
MNRDREDLRKRYSSLSHPNLFIKTEVSNMKRNYKLDESSVLFIRDALKHDVPPKILADDFDVHQSTISDIKLKKTWKHL